MQKDRSENTNWMGLLCIAALFTFVQARDLYKDIRAQSWTTLEGSLSREPYQTPPNRDPETGDIMGPLFGIEIRFNYIVGGCLFTSTNKSFGFTFSEDFELLHGRNTNKAKVKVYVNPRNPNEAVLMPGPKTFNLVLTVLGALSMYWLLKQIVKP